MDPGNIYLGLYHEVGGNHFALMEIWASQAQLDADIAKPHAQAFIKVFNFMIVEFLNE